MSFRTELIQFRVTEKEKEKLKEKAKQEEKTLAEYIRKKCNL